MPFSTAQRERLVSPLNLAVMVGVFAASFTFLRPDYVPGVRYANQPVLGAANNAAEMDALGLAYLKAQSHIGGVDNANLIAVMKQLLQSGRVDEAKKMIVDHPNLSIDGPVRFEVDLEFAAAGSTTELYSALEALLSKPKWHSEPLLARAAELSYRLQHPTLTLDVYEGWAAVSRLDAPSDKDIHVANIYEQCGHHMVSLGDKQLAMQCYQKALDTLPDRYSPFEVQVAMLRMSELGSEQQNEIIKQLSAEDNYTIAQLEDLATVLLSVEKPELAYVVYGDLAKKDNENASRWLPEASRWAVASGKPAHGAVYLDDLLAIAAEEDKADIKVRLEDLLLQAGNTEEALRKIKIRIEESDPDVELLERAITIALQAGEPRQAFLWNSDLIALQPDQEMAMHRQGELALAMNDLPLALEWSTKQVALHPSDKHARSRLAKVSEWSGKSAISLTQWRWLADNTNVSDRVGKTRALQEVVRLASATLQPKYAASALKELSLIEAPSDEDLVRLVDFYKLDGRSHEVASALNEISVQHGPNAFLLRTLSAHEYAHSEYGSSLEFLNEYELHFGSSVHSTLSKMELLWRLDRKDAAARSAKQLKGQSLLSQATDYQLRLLAEIAWQYRQSWLAALVQPQLQSLEREDQRNVFGRRSLAALQDSGENELAMRESVRLWSSTKDINFALIAMQLAIKTGNSDVLNQFEPTAKNSSELVKSPAYWASLASIRLRSKDNNGAREAYMQALTINPSHIESVSGLLWLGIADHDHVYLQSLLKEYQVLAEGTPELWQAMAVGYLQIGGASTSIQWFDRMLDQMETDYSMLLTYADALEYAGRASGSRKVRQYALQQLRPALVQGMSNEQELLLSQYARLSARYGGVGENQQLVQYLRNDDALAEESSSDEEQFRDILWRDEMAISWMMSSQQHDHARLIIADLHAQRLLTPAWQQLALALNDKDEAAVKAIMASSGPLSIGNHILALRQLGQDKEAYELAAKALAPGARIAGSDLSDKRVAEEQYVLLRDKRPSYLSGEISNRSLVALGISDVGVTIRHTFAGKDIGYAFSLSQRQLESDTYLIQGQDEVSDFSASLFYETNTRKASLTAGARNTEMGDESYGAASVAMMSKDQRRELSAEVAINENVELSPELMIAGVQNRAALAFETEFGKREFVRLQAELTEINTRYEQQDVANGLEGSIEVGMHGNFGSNYWTTSVQASQIARERVEILPFSLRLAEDSTLDDVVAEESQTVAVGATLSRGGLDTDYPQASSPRYYFHTNIAKTWPQESVDVQVDAGAGIRVLGGDELRFSVTHDTEPSSSLDNDATTLGVQYRYHFQ